MVRVGAHAQVETFLAGRLDEVLVGADAGRLEGLRAQLLIFVGNEVDAQREVVDGRALPAEIEDADLGIGYTTVEAGLGVRLEREVSCLVAGFISMKHWSTVWPEGNQCHTSNPPNSPCSCSTGSI